MTTSKKKSKKNNRFKIIVDTREQQPYFLTPLALGKLVNFEINTLKTGDYSIAGFSDPATCKNSICIERKSMADLFNTIGNGRKRFERELFRMSFFDYALIMIEGNNDDIRNNPPPISQMNPYATYNSLIAFSQRYGVHVWACSDRNLAEETTYTILKRFFDDKKKGGKMNFDHL